MSFGANCNEDIAEHEFMVIEKCHHIRPGMSNHRLEDRKKIKCFNIMLID